MILNNLVPKNISSNVSKSQIPDLNPSLSSACPGGCFPYLWKSLFHTIRNMFRILSAGQTPSAGGVVFERVLEDFWVYGRVVFQRWLTA